MEIGYEITVLSRSYHEVHLSIGIIIIPMIGVFDVNHLITP